MVGYATTLYFVSLVSVSFRLDFVSLLGYRFFFADWILSPMHFTHGHVLADLFFIRVKCLGPYLSILSYPIYVDPL